MSGTTFPTAACWAAGMTKYFEDFVAGDSIELGSVEVTEGAILKFAHEFDPQPFHIDPVAAKATPFGGLIASGWHTCAMYMRLMYDGMLADSSSQGASGMEELRWLEPVRPGDTLTARYTVLEVQRSSTKPHRGTVMFQSEMLNQNNEVVLRMKGRGLYGTRDGAPS
jgi:acyl dehydratase